MWITDFLTNWPQKVKLGKDFDNYVVDAADWGGDSDRRVRVVTIVWYETSL